MNLKRTILLISVLSLYGCTSTSVTPKTANDTHTASSSEKQELSLNTNNPFAHDNTLPYQAPEFDKIKSEHFAPALKVGMAKQLKEVEQIANNPEPASFDNTIAALQKTGRLFNRVAPIFDNYTNAYTNDTIKEIEIDMAPLFAAHSDAIHLNNKLFARIESLHDKRSSLALDPESLRLLETNYRDFVRAGAKLNAEQKEKIKAINAEISSISTQVGQNILSEMHHSAVLVDTKEELDGLAEAQIQEAAEAAKSRGHEGKYLITLTNTSTQPILASLNNRELRKKIHNASLQRNMQENDADNRDPIAHVLKLKTERAQMLGYPSHAAYRLETQCAQNVEAVNNMLSSMVPASLESLKREAAELQKIIDSENGGFELAAYDWLYYSEKLRKQKYDLDEAELKPYFELNSVITKGVFYTAERLYGITFKERHDLPVYDPDVRIWEVYNEDGSTIGLFYGDFYARDNKRGGAWMSEYVEQSHLLGTKPVILNQTNFTKPLSGPTLLTTDEVTTVFHEFGHALHGLLSNVKYPEFSGTSVPRDFVEFPSQINETWALHPEILENYALHYETNEKMPASLVKKLDETKKFNQGYMTTEYLAAAMLDQAWFQHSADNIPDLSHDNFEKTERELLAKVKLDLDMTPPRYRSAYFNHVFAGGYDAGYYAYIWSEVLDADGEQWFKEQGLNREAGQKFRDHILSKGNTADPMKLYYDLTERSPSSEHLLTRRGLN